jgi:hypothetical protein
MNIIFLDIDGVLNCQTFYEDRHKGLYDKKLKICPKRMEWFNKLCEETKAKVVISSTWRLGRTTEQLINMFKEYGGTFEIIDRTPNLKHEGCVRGNEINIWIEKNKDLLECEYYNFHSYAIIDDDSDMLLQQQYNFFQTDDYSGLTPNICYKIKRHFNKFSNK